MARTISGKSRLLRSGLRTRTHRRCRVVEEGLHLLGEVNALIVEMNTSTKFVLSFEVPSAMLAFKN
jgi:hypothetical protein